VAITFKKPAISFLIFLAFLRLKNGATSNQQIVHPNAEVVKPFNTLFL